MNDKPEPLWWRTLKRLLPPWWRTQAPPDVDGNTQRLYRTPVNEPTFRCIMDHAVVQLGNELAAAMEEPRGPERDRHLDRGAGLKAFIDEVESKREIWREHVRRDLEGKQ